jgi:hypothetical protein
MTNLTIISPKGLTTQRLPKLSQMARSRSVGAPNT